MQVALSLCQSERNGEGEIKGERPAELETAVSCGTKCELRCLAALQLKSIPAVRAHGAHSTGLSVSYLFGGSQGNPTDKVGWRKPHV